MRSVLFVVACGVGMSAVDELIGYPRDHATFLVRGAHDLAIMLVGAVLWNCVTRRSPRD